MIIEAYVLLFIAPGGQPYYTQDPPVVLPRERCLAEAERRGGKRRDYVCEVRS